MFFRGAGINTKHQIKDVAAVNEHQHLFPRLADCNVLHAKNHLSPLNNLFRSETPTHMPKLKSPKLLEGAEVECLILATTKAERVVVTHSVHGSAEAIVLSLREHGGEDVWLHRHVHQQHALHILHINIRHVQMDVSGSALASDL